MDLITDDDTSEAIFRLRNGRATSTDVWAPIDWKRLPPKAHVEMGNLLRKAEKVLVVPLQALFNLMVLMGKPSGGSVP